MKISFATRLKEELVKIKQKKPNLFRKIQKQLKLFREDPKYPSLKNHRLTGPLKKSYSISIEGNIRMIYHIDEDEAIFSSIGTHDQVYREKK